MVFDGFFISKMIDELQKIVVGGHLEKIVYFNNVFVFTIYNAGMKHNLLIDINSSTCGFYISKKKIFEAANNAFLLTLKNKLKGAKLLAIRQHLTDRIIIFDFQVSDYINGISRKELIFEAMGKYANLLLVEENIIIDCFKHYISDTNRTTIPKAKYLYMDTNKKPFTMIDYNNIKSAKDLTDTYLGISSLLANFLVAFPLKLSDIKVSPTKYGKKHYVFNVFGDENVQTYNTLSELFEKEKTANNQNYFKQKQFIEKQLVKNNKRKNILLNTKQEAMNDLLCKEVADNIYGSGLDLNSRLAFFNEVSLEYSKTLNENAQLLYKKYQKAKRTLLNVEEQLKICEDNSLLYNDYLNQLTFLLPSDIEELNEELKITKNKQVSKKIRISKIVYENTTYYLGRNHTQNAYLIQKLADKNNYWFHIKDGTGSHVVADTDNLTEKIIRTASQLAAYYSSFNTSSSIPVDYTQVKYLKNIKGHKGFFVSYRNHKTIYIDIDNDLINKLNGYMSR